MTTAWSASDARGAILACFDGSDGGRRAVWWAAGEAAAAKRPLVIVWSLEWDASRAPRGADAGNVEDEEIVETARRELGRVADDCRSLYPRLTVLTAVPEGAPEVTVTRLADEIAPVMVVAGASGRGALSRMLLGSTVAYFARFLSPPLVVVRGEPAPPEAPVIVGVDGSGTSVRAVEFALAFAERHGVGVRAVHSWTEWPLDIYATAPPAQAGLYHVDDSVQQAAREDFERAARRYPDVAVEWEAVTDRPTHALLERGEGARLLVVGSHGRGPVTRALLGSVSHAVLYHAPCPVAVLRSRAEDDEFLDAH
ncbi:universal stress protein [Saccharomonospora glauca]|jgi:nucleotide-binding universal stress UspA family protein|uniref:Universal stress protein UspA-like protein n=1 Tax=Saccharomonospora glauca K62 TaxID=928724 RepID=I1CYR8_9PSEU|nr:universal stress protein [Saccharomonospora glauca]EIE97842.1 universal stress protein UspA-like protein [Saccharomonospora glauca K62]